MIQRWTADKIRAELKSGKLPLVQKRATEYSNLGAGTAVRLEGTYEIEVKKIRDRCRYVLSSEGAT